MIMDGRNKAGDGDMLRVNSRTQPASNQLGAYSSRVCVLEVESDGQDIRD